MDYFNYCHGLTMTLAQFDRLFGGPPRRPESPLTQREMDLAASIQAVTEEIMLRMARARRTRTTGHARTSCLAGGVALNCVANGRLLREGPFDDIWIQPAAGDAGGALGAALFVWHQLLGNAAHGRRRATASRARCSARRSPTAEIRAFLDASGAPYRRVRRRGRAAATASPELLADGKVVGWFQGRMEFGPRALGARSILGDPRGREMQSTMNLKIKFRESFRPFAPSVLRRARRTSASRLPREQDSPYMLLVAPVRAEQAARRRRDGDGCVGLDRLQAARARRSPPSPTSTTRRASRPSTPSGNPRFHRLLEAFDEQTGCPVLVNTSFNVRGEPIVCTPEDAYRCFLATEMDVLVLEDFVLLKEEQPASARPPSGIQRASSSMS